MGGIKNTDVSDEATQESGECVRVYDGDYRTTARAAKKTATALPRTDGEEKERAPLPWAGVVVLLPLLLPPGAWLLLFVSVGSGTPLW
jgi:hypothetical protein